MDINARKVNDWAIMPKKLGASEFGLFVPDDTELVRGRQSVQMGVSVAVPDGFGLMLLPLDDFSQYGIECEYMPGQGSFSGSKVRVDADILGSVLFGDAEVSVVINVRERLVPDGRVWLKRGTCIAKLVPFLMA